jgi:DNA-binding transcriptional ArsR family regulator
LYNKISFYNGGQMQDVRYIEEVEQALALLKPQRLEILKRLAEPRTCPELAAIFDDSPQKIYYHVKALEAAGLVDKIAERRVRGAVEGIYQARARSYWLAPSLVGQIGSPSQARDQASLRVLLALAEDVIEDAGKLGERSGVGGGGYRHFPYRRKFTCPMASAAQNLCASCNRPFRTSRANTASMRSKTSPLASALS